MKFKDLKVNESYILNISNIKRPNNCDYGITDYGYVIVPNDMYEEPYHDLIEAQAVPKQHTLLLVDKAEAFLIEKTKNYAVFKDWDIDGVPSPKFKLSVRECEQAILKEEQ